MNALLPMLNMASWIALILLVPVGILTLKLGRYLDQATQTSEAKQRDHERNFALKNKAEDVLREMAVLCRIVQIKVERETPPPPR